MASYVCDCVMKCQYLVDAESVEEAAEAAAKQCYDNAPMECTCSPLRRDYELDEILPKG